MKPRLPKDAPRFFGEHPSMRALYEQAVDAHVAPLSLQIRKTVPLSSFRDERHPAVTLIPRDQHVLVEDEVGDVIGLFEHRLWFSSHNIHIDTESLGVFHELDSESNAFWRMGGIPQLGYLVPPYPEQFPETSISILPPIFPHTRWIHCRLAAALADVILARNGFSQEERNPFVLTTAYHDIAMPAGGDSVKRVDPQGLDEETNFLYALDLWNLVPGWKQKYGFDPQAAHAWVQNKGMLGQLLDVVDKLSYVSLDVYHLARFIDGSLRQLCMDNPLFMDVWQDIRFTPDKTRFAFTDPNRLYVFLLARAYEHNQLLFNPYARVLDFFLTNLVRPLYERKKITKKQLPLWTTERLQIELMRHYPEQQTSPWLYTPEDYHCIRCATQAEVDDFVHTHRERVYSIEYIPGFRTGLEWPVYANKRMTHITTLRSILSKQRIARIESLAESCKGFLAYSYKTKPSG